MCSICFEFPDKCSTRHAVYCAFHKRTDSTTWREMALVVWNVLTAIAFLDALVAASNPYTSACVTTQWLKMVCEVLEVVRWFFVLVVSVYFWLVVLWDTINDTVAIQVTCLGAADVAWAYSRVQLFVLVASLGLLLADYLILAIANPNDFCMMEEASLAWSFKKLSRATWAVSILVNIARKWSFGWFVQGGPGRTSTEPHGRGSACLFASRSVRLLSADGVLANASHAPLVFNTFGLPKASGREIPAECFEGRLGRAFVCGTASGAEFPRDVAPKVEPHWQTTTFPKNWVLLS